MSAVDLTKNQRGILLYCESCLVDRSGMLTGARMNEDDIKDLKAFQEAGLLRFGRIPFKMLRAAGQSADTYPSTHWVEFTDGAWALAHECRRARSEQRSTYAKEVFEATTPATNTEGAGND